MVEQNKVYATGRRKRSIARVWVTPGKGDIKVNKIVAKDYFQRQTLTMVINQPFETTKTVGKYDVIATVKGGGISGQAGALRHGISRALVKTDETLKTLLKRGGFLTRDSREKERKKYGQKGARKRFQFSKR